MAYATQDDVFNLGFSAAAFVSRPRAILAADVELSTGKIRLKGHGFSPLDLILFDQVATGSLPIDATNVILSGFTYYTPIRLGNDIFQVADPATGLPFTFSDAGRGWGISIDPLRRLNMHLEETASQIDECLTAESPPIKVDPVTGLYPWQLRGMNARMAALAAVTSLSFDNPETRKAFDRIEEQRGVDSATRDGWRLGKPLLPTVVDQDSVPNAAARARNSAGRISMPWVRGSL